MKKISFIGGGNMAEAIIHGLQSDKQNQYEINVFEPNQERIEYLKKRFSINFSSSLVSLLDKQSDAIIIAVKPQVMPKVLDEIKSSADHKILISIAAGVITSTIEKSCPKAKIVRIMPNTPFLCKAGVGGVSFDEKISPTEKEFVMEIFANSGKLIEVNEDKMHAVTAISGSGPAYFFYLAEHMIQQGQNMGLTADEAKVLTIETMHGAAKLLLESQEEPAELRRKVTSPNGTTEAAIRNFVQSQLGESFQKGLQKACDRSKELAGET